MHGGRLGTQSTIIRQSLSCFSSEWWMCFCGPMSLSTSMASTKGILGQLRQLGMRRKVKGVTAETISARQKSARLKNPTFQQGGEANAGTGQSGLKNAAYSGPAPHWPSSGSYLLIRWVFLPTAVVGTRTWHACQLSLLDLALRRASFFSSRFSRPHRRSTTRHITYRSAQP